MCCTRYILINIGNNLPLPQTIPPTLRPRASSNEPGSPCSAVCFNKSNYSGLLFCERPSSHPSWEVWTCVREIHTALTKCFETSTWREKVVMRIGFKHRCFTLCWAQILILISSKEKGFETLFCVR